MNAENHLIKYKINFVKKKKRENEKKILIINKINKSLFNLQSRTEWNLLALIGRNVFCIYPIMSFRDPPTDCYEKIHCSDTYSKLYGGGRTLYINILNKFIYILWCRNY